MGADGGVDWVRLRAGVTWTTAYDLVEPFWHYLNDRGGSANEDSRTLWILENERADSMYAGYGTDMEGYGWRAFGGFIEELQGCLGDWRGLTPRATFQDYLDELDTRPEEMGVETRGLAHWVGCLREAPEDFLARPIREWLGAVRGAFHTRPLGRYDTPPVELSFELETGFQRTWT